MGLGDDMTAADDITEKIRRLLSLADNEAATPAEAGAALERARRLADRHRIDLERVRAGGEPEEAITHITVDLPQRVSLNRKMAISTACQFFRVNAVLAPPCLVLVVTGYLSIASVVLCFVFPPRITVGLATCGIVITLLSIGLWVWLLRLDRRSSDGITAR